MKLVGWLLASLAAAARGGKYMRCGEGVPLCGVLALESGFGRSRYHHPEPSVHGLWPQVGRYGTSECLRPAREGPTRKIYSCYAEAGGKRSQILWFEGHEWTTHGRCAGASDEDDFFGQVCKLSGRPLDIMEEARPRGFQGMISALRAAGLPVYAVDSYNDQIELSACAASDGRWHLAPVEKFGEVCGAGRHAPPAPPAGRAVCVPNRHGPRCHSDGQCAGLAGCARCARSGFCTDLPLLETFAEATTVKEEAPVVLTDASPTQAATGAPAPVAHLERRRRRLPRLALVVLLAAGLVTGLSAARAWRRWGGGGEAALVDSEYLSI